MKTTQNIIKVETNRLKGTTTTNTNNYQNSPEAFNKHFLSITEIIIHDIRCNNKVTTLTKIQTITCQTYFINLFLV